MEGNYTAPPEVLAQLERDGRVVFRYCDAQGRVTDEANPNGATAASPASATRRATSSA